MTQFQPSDEFKKMFFDSAADDFDVKDQVLQKLYERKKQKEAFRVKKKVSLIVAACLVFGVSSAYAAIKVYELKNDKGEVVVKAEQTESPEQQPLRPEEKLNEIRNTLQPGTAVAIYIAGESNPDKNMSFMQEPFTFTDYPAMKSKVENFFELPDELVGGYTFNEGSVDLLIDYNQTDMYEEMIQEAERTKKDVVVRTMKTGPNIKRMVTDYKGTKGEVHVIVESLVNTKYISQDVGPGETVEKLQVHGKEALYYVKKLMNSEKGLRFIQFFKADTNQVYEVRSTSPDVSKNDLLAIVEKLK